MALSKISDTDKQRLYDAAQAGEDFLLLANQLNIKSKTAKNIVSRIKSRNGVISLPRGGNRGNKVDEIMNRTIF